MSDMYQVNRPGQMQPPKRKAWVRRHKLLSFLCAAGLVLVAAAVIVPRLTAALSPRDYRDPVQLAQAVKAAEQAKTGNMAGFASCSKYIGGKYFCAVAFPGGTEGNYVVSVSADGRSWTAA